MGDYKKKSLSLTQSVALGTGVMIGAGIFALLGQIAELSGTWFPYIFIIGLVISAFSAYSYIKVSNAYPSAGGIAMILTKAYGKSFIAGAASVLMALSMIINESLVARTFGSYTLQLFNVGSNSIWVPALGVFLLIIAYLINLSGNEVIGKTSQSMAFIKIAGILILAVVGLWVANITFNDLLQPAAIDEEKSLSSFVAAIALSILAYKGFTTITNSGSEINKPHKNIGRAIIISLMLCAFVYLLVALAVKANLTVSEVIKAKDYALAEAARPLFGNYGLYLTVGIAIVATISGVIASIFAVSRMTAMLTDMELIPYRDFGLFGSLQKNMLTYIVVLAILLTIFFDLSRIASIGAIFYLIMDIIVHWGVFKFLKKEVKAVGAILITSIVLDVIVLIAFLWFKAQNDLLIVVISLFGLLLVFSGEYWYLNRKKAKAG